MTFKPAIWQPIAIALSAVNLVAVGLAAGAAEPWHAALHSGLALALGLWAQRMRRGPRPPGTAAVGDGEERLEMLEAEVGNLRGELNEVQERLDFAERVLARGKEAPRVGPER